MTIKVKAFHKVVGGKAILVGESQRGGVPAPTVETNLFNPDRPALTATPGKFPEQSTDGRPAMAGKPGKFPRGRSVPIPSEARAK